MGNRSEESNEIDETIVIVGYHDKSKRFFSSSRCGESFLNEYVWVRLNGENAVEKGGIYHARIQIVNIRDGDMHRVLKLYRRVKPWEGVIIHRNISVELNAVVLEQRRTCFALETEPFGLVTYPFDSFLPTDINCGDNLRVTLARHKNVCGADYPSKWQVIRVIEVLPKIEKNRKREGSDDVKMNNEKEEKEGSNLGEEKEWFEGVVTCVTNPINVLITFKYGTAMYKRNLNLETSLLLGDIVEIRIVSDRKGWFEVVDIRDEKWTRKDLVVLPILGNKCNVFCEAKVIDRRDTYFLLDTPIIGLAIFNTREAPREMEVGDIWRVKMLRRKDKREYPSFWVATTVEGECPRIFSADERRRGRDTVEHTSGHSSRRSLSSAVDVSNTHQDADWVTVIITGSDNGLWYGSCARADPIRIPKNMNQSGKDLKRGAFYRIKISRASDGAIKALDLNPEQVYPEDFECVYEENKSIKFWCGSQIESVQESSFTVHNEVIGDATLPFKRGAKEMRVGDRLETLYYRVKSTSNPTHWMVQEARIVPLKKYYKGDERGIEDERREETSGLREDESLNECRREKKLAVSDSRVLEMTRYFMLIPEVKKAFEKNDPNTLEKIKLILGKM